MNWSPLVSLRCDPDLDPDRVVLSAPDLARRVRVRRSALADLLASLSSGREPGDGAAALATELERIGFLVRGGAGPATGAELTLAEEWWRKGWHPSLSYYLWSRRDRFADAGPDGLEVCRAAISRWIASGAVPPAHQVPPAPAVALPEPRPAARPQPLGQVLVRRKTHRVFRERPCRLEGLGALLRNGLRCVARQRVRPGSDLLRHLQSSGAALVPYLLVFRVEDLAPGAYHYDLEQHALRLVRAGDFRADACDIVMGMKAPDTAALTLVLCADFARLQWLYRAEYALRKLYMDMGLIAQNLVLAGEELGLGTLPTPATKDRKLSALLGIDPVRLAPIYTLTMGPYGAER